MKEKCAKKLIKFVKIRIMTSANIRQKLHQYIDKGDDKLIKLIYAFAKEYNEEEDFEYELSDEQIKNLQERTAKRLNGESKTHNWEEAKSIIIGKKEK